MSDNGSNQEDVFGVERLRGLVELMIEHGLSEVDLRQHGQTIRLRRGGEQVVSHPPARLPMAPSSTAAPPAAASDAEDPELIIIKSPMVGTFYSKPNPDAESFVKIGQDITADTTICIIEAMKVFNPIMAEVAGKVVAVLVDNEEPVEFGRPLFKIRKLK
jgi:acetyl-CoA carboxylase biotin carboxyl carrier protein